MNFFDTHAHLLDEQLVSQQAEVLVRARAAGVTEILAVATDLTTSRACFAAAKVLPGVRASVGIHPNYCHEAQSGDWAEIERLASEGGASALGETGLDKHWDFCPFPMQQDYFARHLALSRKTNLPFIVHMRDCEAETLVMLREAFADGGPLRGVMHSFTGTAAAASECVAMGLFISFAGMLTYKRSDDLREIARQVPADRLLIETDSPYLSPEPFRGQRPNEPARIVHTAQCLADVRGVSLAEIAALTTANAQRLFNRGPAA